MLYSIADAVCLKKLRGIYQGGKIVRVLVGLLEVIQDFSVGSVISLMLFHYIGEDVPVLRIIADSLLHCFDRREGLESELGKIAETVLSIFGERFVSVPYLPEMHVSPVGVLGIVEGAP